MTRFIFFLCLSLVFWVQSSKAQISIETTASQAFIVDHETGTVLFDHNGTQRMPTSSMSKVMTMYLVFEALGAGQLSLDDTLLVSEKAWRKGGSKMFVEVDKKVKVEDLIRGVIVQSGNDATIVLAEGLAGSEERFAEKLTDKAKEIGMLNSNFTNASGWPDENHYSTAQDLTLLARDLIDRFPNYYKYYAETEFSYNNIPQQNRNPLLYRNIGADGVKTGHTEAGGYGLIGSGVEDGRRVIVVVNGLEDEAARAQESAKLLQWGLSRFQNETLFSANEAVSEAKIVMGKEETVPLVLNEDLRVTIPKGSLNNLDVKVTVKEPLVAPIRAGEKLATLTVEIPTLETIEQPLYAKENVETHGLFASIAKKIELLFLTESQTP